MSIKEGIPIEAPFRISDLFSGERPRIEITPTERQKYGLLAVGNFKQEDIDVAESDRKALTPEEEGARACVDAYVKDFIENKNKILAQQGKRAIGDWPKLHCSQVQDTEGRLKLVIEHGMANYAKLIALATEEGINKAYQFYNQQTKAGNMSFERFKELFQPVSLAASGLIFTSDNCVLLAKRHPDKVGTYGEAWHVPAGYVDAADRDNSGQIDLYKAMRREIEEEVGLTEDQISDLTCIGVAKNSAVATVSILFVGHTHLKSTDIVDPNAVDMTKRLLLNPKDIEGDIRPRRVIGPQNQLTQVFPALLKIDKVFGRQKQQGSSGPELAVPSSQALFFLADKMLKQK